jgi:hypothetical protein
LGFTGLPLLPEFSTVKRLIFRKLPLLSEFSTLKRLIFRKLPYYPNFLPLKDKAVSFNLSAIASGRARRDLKTNSRAESGSGAGGERREKSGSDMQKKAFRKEIQLAWPS